jgi:FkbM family methyltransferase
MPSSTTLTLVDDVRIVVPDSLNLITCYVVQEQQDWFEDEIKFVRRLLRPGQEVIDIGANYGVYTLSMAKAVGPAGRVWAFEPASGTARLLAAGINANGFEQVVLEQSALSSACGTAQFALNENSELNALVHGTPPASAVETVRLVTLDDRLQAYGWREIDFTKIDAEGEEAQILMGGERFFAQLSPLVQYEVKAGADLHVELVRDFAARGYASYRLVPGLDLLVPFDADSPVDDYLLNLFCCKQDRADRLADEGLLTDRAPRLPSAAAARSGEISADGSRDPYDWRHTIAKMPYGSRLASIWQQTTAAGNSTEVCEALSQYALSRDPTRTAADRFGALEASLSILKGVCERTPSRLRLASLARVARDYGARSLAVRALQQLSNAIAREKLADASEPFLAPGERFESVPPGEAIGNWVLAAVLEELERLGAFSSFYTGVAARRRLQAIDKLGFASPEMKRRIQLLHRRFGLPPS